MRVGSAPDDWRSNPTYIMHANDETNEGLSFETSIARVGLTRGVSADYQHLE